MDPFGPRGLPALTRRADDSNLRPKEVTDSRHHEASLQRSQELRLPHVRTRNPILGTMPGTWRHMGVSGTKIRQQQNIHQGSMFESTGIRRRFFVVHPEWSSETRSVRRVATRERALYSWESRPSFRPVNDYIIPLLEKRRNHDDRIQAALGAARPSNCQTSQRSSDTPLTFRIRQPLPQQLSFRLETPRCSQQVAARCLQMKLPAKANAHVMAASDRREVIQY